jgi:hypothetical protein
LKIKKVLLNLDIESKIFYCCFFNLKGNSIGNKGIGAIVEMLKINNSLQILNISSIFSFVCYELKYTENNFDDISKLGDALKYNRSLTELVIAESTLFYSFILKYQR